MHQLQLICNYYCPLSLSLSVHFCYTLLVYSCDLTFFILWQLNFGPTRPFGHFNICIISTLNHLNLPLKAAGIMCRTEVGSANRRQKKKKKICKKKGKSSPTTTAKRENSKQKKTREENAISAQTHTFSGAAGKKTNVNV